MRDALDISWFGVVAASYGGNWVMTV
jgi:hypothetical protein